MNGKWYNFLRRTQTGEKERLLPDQKHAQAVEEDKKALINAMKLFHKSEMNPERTMNRTIKNLVSRNVSIEDLDKTMEVQNFAPHISLFSKGPKTYTLLQFAAAVGFVSTINLLAQKLDANVNAKTPYLEQKKPPKLGGELSALHFAAYRNKGNAVEALLNNDADIDATDQYGFTPLAIALLHNSREVFDVLLNRGANPRIKGKLSELQTTLDCCNRIGDAEDMERKLKIVLAKTAKDTGPAPPSPSR